MVKIFNNHLISILFVGIVFLGIGILFQKDTTKENYKDIDLIRSFTELDFLDLSNPEDRLLLREALDIYEPQKSSFHDSLLAEIEQYLINQMRSTAGSRENFQGLDTKKLMTILGMLGKFSAVYLLVLLITYYSVETFAVYRFFRDRSRTS